MYPSRALLYTTKSQLLTQITEILGKAPTFIFRIFEYHAYITNTCPKGLFRNNFFAFIPGTMNFHSWHSRIFMPPFILLTRQSSHNTKYTIESQFNCRRREIVRCETRVAATNEHIHSVNCQHKPLPRSTLQSIIGI